MKQAVAYCVLACAATLWIGLSIAAPWVLSDTNLFLKGFVNHELLAFMGVLVTITLASAANLHLELNRLEEDAAARKISHDFGKTRRSVATSAKALIWLLLISIAIGVVKPLALLRGANPFREAIFNGFALFVLLVSVLILVDLTLTILAIPAKKPKPPA